MNHSTDQTITLLSDPDSEVEFVRPTNTNDGPPQGAGGGPRFPFPGGFGGKGTHSFGALSLTHPYLICFYLFTLIRPA